MTLSVKGSAVQAQWRPFRDLRSTMAAMDGWRSRYSCPHRDVPGGRADFRRSRRSLLSAKSELPVCDSRTSHVD